jgi:hypothetical protein
MYIITNGTRITKNIGKTIDIDIIIERTANVIRIINLYDSGMLDSTASISFEKRFMILPTFIIIKKVKFFIFFKKYPKNRCLFKKHHFTT